ncbi:MAG: hypothetical protein HY367_03645, partial [Candidatus Aenigmarchaeota archaeon]|nr:hypothetical protein [Candidatus Aenigmarchaeota archaeon]
MNSMDAKVFSLQEANSLIPAVSEIFRKVFLLNDSIKSANTDIELLLDIWGDGVYDPRHTDNLYYARRVRLRDDSKKELQRSVD